METRPYFTALQNLAHNARYCLYENAISHFIPGGFIPQVLLRQPVRASVLTSAFATPLPCLHACSLLFCGCQAFSLQASAPSYPCRPARKIETGNPLHETHKAKALIDSTCSAVQSQPLSHCVATTSDCQSKEGKRGNVILRQGMQGPVTFSSSMILFSYGA